MFFDYDGHVNMPRNEHGAGHWDGDEVLGEMLKVFSDETDQGKLFISYPMVEAIQHIDCEVVLTYFKHTKYNKEC